MPGNEGVYVQRTLTYSCPSTDVCLEILEKVDEELSLEAELHAEFRNGKLVFKVLGLEPNVQAALTKLRNFIAAYLSPKTDPRRGVSADIIAKHIRRAVPLDVLAVVVEKTLGVKAEVRGPNIYADTDLDTLLTIAKKLSEAQQKVSQLQLPNTLKKLLMAAMTVYNVSHAEVLEGLKNAGYLNDKNELRIPWTEAVNTLEDLLSTGIA